MKFRKCFGGHEVRPSAFECPGDNFPKTECEMREGREGKSRLALEKFVLKTLPDTEWASEAEADKQKNFKSPSVNGDLSSS